MLSVWLCVERFQSFSTASMQQFVSFNQQRYLTAVVILFYLSRITLTSTFACQYFCSDCLRITVTECVAERVTSNSGKRSDAFHSTSENCENLNW